MAGTEHDTQTHSHSLTCEACGAKVPALRRGRCPFCYLRWTDARPVGLGAACVVCGERRRENLRSVEFQRKWVNMCHNCATRTFQMQPLPHTIEAIRQRMSRDRRWQERRVGRSDQRIFKKDRRVGERRTSLPATVGDYIDATDLVVEIIDDAKSGCGESCGCGADATRIAVEEEHGQDLEGGAEANEAGADNEATVCSEVDHHEAKVLVDDELLADEPSLSSLEALAEALADQEAAEELEADVELQVLACDDADDEELAEGESEGTQPRIRVVDVSPHLLI